jgi:hypothetical protein
MTLTNNIDKIRINYNKYLIKKLEFKENQIK